MAQVFLAEATGPRGFRKRCVIKVIHEALASDPFFVKMFVKEAGLAAHFEHDNIVRVFDFGREDNRYFIAMEHIRGRTLRQVARRYRDLGRPPTVWFLLRAAIGVCSALEYLHGFSSGEHPLQLVHRDISPENVMVSFNGTVKLLDFGVACSRQNGPNGVIVGKYRYMPPERLDGSVGDARGDIYSLGMILYELLVGESPFVGSEEQMAQAILRGPRPLDEVAPQLPATLRATVMRAIGPHAKRYVDAESFRLDLIKAARELEPDAMELSMVRELGHLFAQAKDLPSNVRVMLAAHPAPEPPRSAAGEFELDFELDLTSDAQPATTPPSATPPGEFAAQADVEVAEEPPAAPSPPPDNEPEAEAEAEAKAAPAPERGAQTPFTPSVVRDEPSAGSVFDRAVSPPASPARADDDDSAGDIFSVVRPRAAAPATQSSDGDVFSVVRRPQAASSGLWSHDAAPATRGQDDGSAPAAESPPPTPEAEACFDRGFAAMRAGHYALAEMEWERALALEPGNRKYQTNLKRLQTKYKSKTNT